MKMILVEILSIVVIDLLLEVGIVSLYIRG